MTAIPLTALECSLEAERLLGQAIHRSGEDSDRAIAMADVYARLAHVAIIRETAGRDDEK
jgi:hypothetical protein